MVKTLDNETLDGPQQIVFLTYYQRSYLPYQIEGTLFPIQLRLLPNLKGKPFIYFLSEFFEKLICFDLIHVFSYNVNFSLFKSRKLSQIEKKIRYAIESRTRQYSA